jgi:hypothetical protein
VYGRIATVVALMDQFAHIRAHTPLREARLALRIGVIPMEGTPMPTAHVSRPCVPSIPPSSPAPSRFLVRPRLLTCAHPLWSAKTIAASSGGLLLKGNIYNANRQGSDGPRHADALETGAGVLAEAPAVTRAVVVCLAPRTDEDALRCSVAPTLLLI